MEETNPNNARPGIDRIRLNGGSGRAVLRLALKHLMGKIDAHRHDTFPAISSSSSSAFEKFGGSARRMSGTGPFIRQPNAIRMLADETRDHSHFHFSCSGRGGFHVLSFGGGGDGYLGGLRFHRLSGVGGRGLHTASSDLLERFIA